MCGTGISTSLACGCFAGASITDAFDGYLARRWRVESRLGAFLDPVADKLLVVTTLVALTASTPGVALPAAVIVAREVAVSALREYCADRGQRDAVAVGGAGKLKTATQMAALLVLTGRLAPRAGLGLLRVSAALALYSGALLFAQARPVFAASDGAPGEFLLTQTTKEEEFTPTTTQGEGEETQRGSSSWFSGRGAGEKRVNRSMHGSSSTDRCGNDPATNVARKGRLSVLMRPMSAWKPASSGGANTKPFSARSWSPGSSRPLACEESDTEETSNVRAGGARGPQKSSAASPFDLRRSSGMGGGTGAPRSRANERSRRACLAALREASSCHGAAPSDAAVASHRRDSRRRPVVRGPRRRAPAPSRSAATSHPRAPAG